MELFDSRGDESLREFMSSAVDPAWPAEAGHDAVRERLAELRVAARGLSDSVSVEREPDGVSLELAAGGVERRVRVVLSEAGIRHMTLAGAAPATSRPLGRAAAIRAHVRALESSGQQNLEALLRTFEERHLSAVLLAKTTSDERRALFERIRSAAASTGSALLAEKNDEIILELQGPDSIAVVFEVEPHEPFAITALRTQALDGGGRQLSLTWEGAAATFAELAADGFSGVVHLERDGKTVLHAACGKSNAALGYDTRLDSVYCIGSTPIDFTVAALNLLTQRGELDPGTTIGEFFPGVPSDKRSMTVGHLISGQSGLPDFHHVGGADWDRDLAWIDRETAVARILAQPLLFAPGTSRAHSHSTFGLAAAVIEIVSGQDYFTFIRDAFFRPAGMSRTGMYGDPGGLTLRDFAVGRGASSLGPPNIPPNWGPTSWLIMGSGGMYSTLDDLLRFRAFVSSDKLFEERFSRRYRGDTVGVGGSDRGFYVFHASSKHKNQALILINGEGRSPEIEALSRALEILVMRDPE